MSTLRIEGSLLMATVTATDLGKQLNGGVLVCLY